LKKARVKAKNKNGITKVKAIFTHPMISEDSAKKKGVKANYMTNIIVKHKGDTVYDASIGIMLSVNPYVKFNFSGGAKGDKLEITAIDNTGASKVSKGKIK
jgi:sulfur-oxidizing protein SoxZ